MNDDITFTLQNPSHQTLVQINYVKATNKSQHQTLPNVTLQINSNWDIQIDKNGIVTDDEGLYIMSSYKQNSFCSYLYIFGKPQKPVLSHDNSNRLGEIDLSCSSSSTTYPANHSLGFNFSWEVNDIRNPPIHRYKYGISRKTLTIVLVNKEDVNKRFKCIATESGDGVIGLTSDKSDEFVFRVIYGPDANTTTFSPPFTEYTLNEGVHLNDIICIGDCYPRCIFKWTKFGTNGPSDVSNNAVLSFGTLSRTEAATYTCEVTNANTTVRKVKKQVEVNVNYASLIIEGHENQKNVTVDEYDTDIQFHCEVASDQELRIQILFKDVLLKEAHQSTFLTFTRSSITCSHAGIYTCKGSSQHAQAPSSSINLFVRCSPRPLQQIKQNETSPLYVSVSLTFTTIAYPEPGPKGFLWYKENGVAWMPLLSNNDLLVSSTGLQSTLTILNVSQSDFGRYKETATNNIGSYLEYLVLEREDIQRESDTTEPCKEKSNQTGTTVGICFGVLSAFLAVYAGYLTVLHKRRSTH